MNYASCSVVVQALFSLQAFGRIRMKATRQVADKCHMGAGNVRQILKGLVPTGLIGSTLGEQRALWISRQVTGKKPTSFKRSQYLADAATVQQLAQMDSRVRALLGTTDLSRLDVRNNEAQRRLFNAVVKVFAEAGHKGLPIYDFSGASYFWWLNTTSRAAAEKVIQQFRGKARPP